MPGPMAIHVSNPLPTLVVVPPLVEVARLVLVSAHVLTARLVQLLLRSI